MASSQQPHRQPIITFTDEAEVAIESTTGAEIIVAVRRCRRGHDSEYALRVRLVDGASVYFDLNPEDFDRLTPALEGAIARARELGILPPATTL